MQFAAVFQQVPEGYIGFIEELPGANTQGATLEEARANLAEAVELVLEANRALSQESIQGQQVIRESSETLGNALSPWNGLTGTGPAWLNDRKCRWFGTIQETL